MFLKDAMKGFNMEFDRGCSQMSGGIEVRSFLILDFIQLKWVYLKSGLKEKRGEEKFKTELL